MFKEREIQAYIRRVLKMTFAVTSFINSKRTLNIYISVNHTRFITHEYKNSEFVFHQTLNTSTVLCFKSNEVSLRINRINFNTFRYVMNFQLERMESASVYLMLREGMCHIVSTVNKQTTVHNTANSKQTTWGNCK